ncbi:efflux RND transporter periplasmic adaptor subunit [Piscinibacter sp. XHJ-5]|uniref:efflux RND transporter periplasmic adaptor subunit n=1 Tax=Piscinibacter sp. XHJ-5 TaxID=3037797 RepID=UPI0024529CDE|nr:efflux RND transporter periplasmic adaptor subunit [Piscinibacter sp. XHJ-5]
MKHAVKLVSAAVALTLCAVGGWLHDRAAAATATTAAASSPKARRDAGASTRGPRAQPVSVGVVQQRDMPVTLDAVGTITASNTAVVHAKVSGELKALYFAEGRPVRAGQVLALIDPQPFAIALEQAQGQLSRDQAQLRNAQLDLERYRALIDKDAAPKQQLDTQQALVQQLQGTLLADQAAVDNARLQLSYTRVLAPISGLAGLKQADLGNVVNPADANGLLSIAQTQPAAVVFAVPDAVLPRIRERLRAGAPLPVEARDRDGKTVLAQGRVASNDNAIDTATGTLKLKALFANADNQLFANQSVHVRLQLDSLPAALTVPAAAVQRGAPGTYVYALNGDGTARLERITVSATDGETTAVQGSLHAGDKVVIDGADRLRDGARVDVAPTR